MPVLLKPAWHESLKTNPMVFPRKRLRFPHEPEGVCSLCNQERMVIRCLNTDCRELFCIECDAINPCLNCGIPVCHRCKLVHCGRRATETQEDDTAMGTREYNGWQPSSITCESCGYMKDFSASWDCESCGGQQCLNNACHTILRTAVCCGREVCHHCCVVIKKKYVADRCNLSQGYYFGDDVHLYVCKVCFYRDAPFNHSNQVAPMSLRM